MNSNFSVLLVEDSHNMLELLRRNMNDLGLNPFATSNVMDAIEILEKTEIDLLITDLKMPQIGGIQLIPTSTGTSSRTTCCWTRTGTSS